MNADRVRQILQDCALLHHAYADPELEAVSVAILVEDVFGLTLDDEEIDTALLADVAVVAGRVCSSARGF